VSIAGALGRTAIVTSEICPANVNQALALIRLPKDSEISPKFLFALFQAGYFKNELDQMGAGAAQQNLSLAQIGSLKVPIFPESKQIEFIEFLNNLRILVTDLKNQLNKQNLLKLELQKSILTTAFLNSTASDLVA
jgi:type I restriction enzyme S subunit